MTALRHREAVPGQVRRSARSRRAVAGLALVAAGLGVAACTSPRNALGTSTARCYEALPVGRGALRGQGRFTGVRYVTIGSLARSLQEMRPRVVDLPTRVLHDRASVCVVAYSGHFTTARVERGWPVDAPSGRYALVVVRVPEDRLVATLVLDKVPLRFSRLFAVGR
ncbi:MAG: hypothetical protein M0Z33_06300 [Actinomycetota bacterium]|nr:hypothetical protein [Actinomycetota bacterium]